MEGSTGVVGDQSNVFDQESGNTTESTSNQVAGEDSSAEYRKKEDPVAGYIVEAEKTGETGPSGQTQLEPTPDTALSEEVPQIPRGSSDDSEQEEWLDHPIDAWVTPGTFTSERVPEGLYRGREVVGSAGSLLSVPALPPRIAGLDRRSDLEADVHSIGALKVAAGSLRGAAHFESAEVRQDSYALGSSRDEDWLIVSLADGVSSGKFSHLAASTACLHGTAGVRDLLSSSLPADGSTDMLESLNWPRLSKDIRGAVLAQARKILGGAIKSADGHPADLQSVPPETYAQAMSTTYEVSVVACRPDVQGRHPFVRVVFAGDGSGYILDPRRGWKVLGLGKNQNPQIASNSVVPLPIDPGPPLITTGYMSQGQALVLTTDGIGDFLADGSTALGGYLHTRWSTPQGLGEYINTLSFVTRQADDDRTAVVVWT